MVQDKKTYKHIVYAVEDMGNNYWYSWVPARTLKEAKILYREEIRIAKNNIEEFGPFGISIHRIDTRTKEDRIIKFKGVR